jgi:hypothetical protein
VVRHSATRPISGWTAIVLGVAVTLIASLVALTLTDSDARDPRSAGLPLRPPVVEEPSLSPEPVPSSAAPSPSVSVSRPPSPSRTPSRSPSPAPPKLTAKYVTNQQFDDGQLGTVTVKNAGTATVDWTVTVEFVDGTRVTRARVVSGGQDVDADRTDDGVRLTGRITAGSTIVIALAISRPESTSAAPRSCVVNGVPCQ